MNKNLPRLSAALLAGVLAACGSSNNDASSGNAGIAGNGGTIAAPTQTLAITSTQDFASGAAFGSTGAYEQVSGTIKGEVDPKDPKNAIIQDLALAPVNARGDQLLTKTWPNMDNNVIMMA